MEAGIIDYKLCDRNFDCENCPFDAIIRSGKDFSRVEEQNQSETPATDSRSKSEHRANAPQSLAEVLRLPPVHSKKDRYYGFSYWYVAQKSATTALLGLNRLAVTLLPSIKDVILPSPHAGIKRGKTFCWFILNEGTLCLPSPVNGVVLRVNEHAAGRLGNKNDPDGVWLAEVRGDDLTDNLNGMLKAAEADAFLQAQRSNMLAVLSTFTNEHQADLGRTLQDGGVYVRNLEEMLGPKKYFQFLGHVFQNNLTNWAKAKSE